MSKVIDEKVVQMEFDNQQFESGVKTSLNSIEKLKKGLAFEDATDGFNNLNKEFSKGFNMDPLMGAFDAVTGKIDYWKVVAISAVQHVTHQLLNMAEQMVKSLTIAPIKEGFKEYETKMDSVQTIMAGTGEELDVVMAKLNELNAYADKTIYSFSDMTSNIGKFTNAGVKLDTAVAAIQGVANVAAVSGANSAEASRAMYNFAQALSSGYVKLIDWKSIENANMATVEFKTQLLETAVALGTVKKKGDMYVSTTKDANGKVSQAFNATKMFNDSLSAQWMTTEVLTATLAKYSDETTEIGKKAYAAAQDVKTFSQLMDTLKEAVGSGWAETWENVFGNFEEAKALWTSVSNAVGGIIDRQAKARNELLSTWKVMKVGGRSDLIEGFANLFSAITELVKPVKQALRDIFPPMTAEKLAAIVKGFKDFTEALKTGKLFGEEMNKIAEKIRRTFRGLFAIVDILKQAFVAVFDTIKPLFGLFGDGSNKLLDFTAKIGDNIYAFDQWLKENDIFRKALDKVVDGIKVVILVIEGLIVKLKPVWEFIKEVVKYIQTIPDKLKAVYDRLKDTKLGQLFDGFKEKIVGFFTSLKGAMEGIKGVDTSGVTSFADKVRAKLEPLGVVLEKIKDMFSGFWEVLKTIGKFIGKVAMWIISALGDIGKKLGESVKNADFDTILDLLQGGTLVAVGLSIKKFFDNLKGVGDGASGILDNIKGVLDGARGCFEAWQQNIQAKTLLTIAGAVAILTASLIALSLVDGEKLGTGLAAMTAAFGELIASMKLLQSSAGSSKGLTKVTTSMILMSTAILILSAAMAKVAELDGDKISTGIAGITALIGELTASAILMSKFSKQMTKGTTGLIAMAIAVRLLVKPIKELGELDKNTLLKGAATLGAVMGEMAIFTRLAGKLKVTTGVGLITVAAAVLLLGKSVQKFGDMDTAVVFQGLEAMGILLVELAAFTKLTGGAKKMVSISTGMVILGAAMLIFVKAVKGFGELNVETIVKGLAAMAGVLTEITIAMKLMPKSTILIATGLVEVGAALLIIGKALKNMGSMSWEEIGKGLLVMAAALTELTIALNLMKGTLGAASALLVASVAITALTLALKILGGMKWESIIKSLTMLAGVFTILGVAGLVLGGMTPAILGLSAAVLILGAGLLAIGIGVAAFSAGILALVASGSACTLMIETLIGAVIAAIPKMAASIGRGLVEIIKVLSSAVKEIGVLIRNLLVEVAQILVDAAPDLIGAIFFIVGELLTQLDECLPDFIEKGYSIVLSILKGIRDHIGEITDVVVDIVVEMADALGRNSGKLIDAAIDLVFDLIEGLGQGIEDNAERLRDAMFSFCEHLFNAFCKFWGIHSPSTVMADQGGNIVLGLLEGIWNCLGDALKAIGEFFAKIFVAIGTAIKNGVIAGRDFVVNIIKGIGEKISEAKKKAKEVVDKIKEAITEKFYEIKKKGGEVIDKIGEGIVGAWTSLKAGVKTTARKAIDGIKDLWEDIKQAGRDFIQGFIDGIKGMGEKVWEGAKWLGGKAIDGIKKALKMKSPSKEAKYIGEFFDLGLIQGFEEYADKVYDSSSDVGKEAIDGMSNAISKVSDILENDVDATPTIRPIVDLTDVNRSVEEMDGMFASQRAINLSANAGYDIDRRNERYAERYNDISKLENLLKEAMNKPNNTITNTFHIEGDGDPRTIAEEVSRILQRQVERREASWA